MTMVPEKSTVGPGNSSAPAAGDTSGTAQTRSTAARPRQRNARAAIALPGPAAATGQRFGLAGGNAL